MEPTMFFRPDKLKGATKSQDAKPYYYQVFTETPGPGWYSTHTKALESKKLSWDDKKEEKKPNGKKKTVKKVVK